ncbi:putative toxin-antitoxin system toxin component, PIN family [Candidatus Woesearchaeota archaeon RBG_13_36_6]|nr:MAG: putative toxin-antitoxin system toxin component, PIN family [Candidatus Woesearchaeota archaeon RBG_13_36_6]
MGKTKIVLDTNIIISVFGWSGKPRKIFELVLDNQIGLITSPQLILKLKRVSEYPKFSFSSQLKRRITDLILEISTIVTTETQINIIKDDSSDNRLLEAALYGDADFIITGDKHLLNLKEYNGIKILTAAGFLESLKL